MFCANCGTQYEDNGRFCPSCGTPNAAAQEPVYQNPAPTGNPTPFGLDSSSFSSASGANLPYVVMQVTLKEKFLGTGSGNLTELEAVINAQAAKGYRLHTISTASATSQGFFGGDRIQATLVFERL